MAAGDKTVGDRLAELEADLKALEGASVRVKTILWVVIGLATFLPVSWYVSGLIRRGADGQDGVAGSGAPVGAILAWPGEFPAVASGRWQAPDQSEWVICDGRGIPVEGSEDPLAAALRGTYATDADINNGVVHVPDFRGMFLRGADGPTGAAEPLGKSQSDLMRAHKHEMDHVVRNAAVPTASNGGSFSYLGADPNERRMTLEASSDLFGAETRPVNYAVHWIIRVK